MFFVYLDIGVGVCFIKGNVLCGVGKNIELVVEWILFGVDNYFFGGFVIFVGEGFF